jgi:hypothetical protein
MIWISILQQPILPQSTRNATDSEFSQNGRW